VQFTHADHVEQALLKHKETIGHRWERSAPRVGGMLTRGTRVGGILSRGTRVGGMLTRGTGWGMLTMISCGNYFNCGMGVGYK